VEGLRISNVTCESTTVGKGGFKFAGMESQMSGDGKAQFPFVYEMVISVGPFRTDTQ
jgi:hypothetical protein